MLLVAFIAWWTVFATKTNAIVSRRAYYFGAIFQARLSSADLVTKLVAFNVLTLPVALFFARRANFKTLFNTNRVIAANETILNARSTKLRTKTNTSMATKQDSAAFCFAWGVHVRIAI